MPCFSFRDPWESCAEGMAAAGAAVEAGGGGVDEAANETADPSTFWLFKHLNPEPFGLLPLSNLVSKGGPTGLKNIRRLASYSWYLDDDKTPTIVVPGAPREAVYWPGGKLKHDQGVLMYDVNHAKLPKHPVDPLILVTKMFAESAGQPTPDFQKYDIITDSLNLQKLFAFCVGGNEGLFRIDFERVGNTLVALRCESSDLMEIDYESYDYSMKAKCTKGNSPLTEGPHFIISEAELGGLKLLIRTETDCADYSQLPGWRAPDKKAPRYAPEEVEKAKEALADKRAFLRDELGIGNYPLSFIPYGVINPHHLQVVTTYPAGKGFPFFTWAQLFFSGMDSVLVGWFKPGGDFARPAQYQLADINKLMKPLPFAAISKVHDALSKVCDFMRKDAEDGARMGLVWKGKEHLEIYEKVSGDDNAISEQVRDMLAEQIPA